MASKIKGRGKRYDDAHYQAIYNDLKPYVKFGFRIKKGGFTSHEKTRLTRAWNRYGEFSDGLEEGRFLFSPATKSQIRALKKAHTIPTPKGKEKRSTKAKPQINRVVVTNKGVFVPQAKTGNVFSFKDAPKVKVKGKGKNTTIELQTFNKTELFVPRHSGENMLACYMRVLKEYPNVRHVYIAINGRFGLERFSPEAMMRYAPELDDLDAAIKARGYDNEDVFNGFWIIYMKPNPQFK